MSNIMKCKYCDFVVSRFKGRGKFGGRKLARHVMNNHEEEFLKAVGWGGDIEGYLYKKEEDYQYEEAIKYEELAKRYFEKDIGKQEVF